MHRLIFPLFLTILALALSACGPSAQQIQATVEAGIAATATAGTAAAEADRCSDAKLVAYADAVEQLLDRYEAQTEVVGATPRVGLGTPLQRLLDYEDEARSLEAPNCLADYHSAVLVMMQRFRQGYQTFAAQGSDTTIMASLAQGKQLLADLRGALPAIREGTLPGPIALPQ
jgi:long-subunit fatty acid transport protein